MKLTWFGHSAFRLETGGSVVLIDPFLTGNSSFKGNVEDASQGCTHILLTHGHDDHVGDAVAICKNTGATLITVVELAMWLNSQGVENVEPCNLGGTLRQADFEVALTKAFHSSSTAGNNGPVYLGNPAGLIIRAEGKAIYHMGDTDIFGDMALIEELYQPDVGLVPIGDRFTMGAKQAALACTKFFNFKMIVPIHYGTFPIIDPDASKFTALMSGQNVFIPVVGETFDV